MEKSSPKNEETSAPSSRSPSPSKKFLTPLTNPATGEKAIVGSNIKPIIRIRIPFNILCPLSVNIR